MQGLSASATTRTQFVYFVITWWQCCCRKATARNRFVHHGRALSVLRESTFPTKFGALERDCMHARNLFLEGSADCRVRARLFRNTNANRSPCNAADVDGRMRTCCVHKSSGPVCRSFSNETTAWWRWLQSHPYTGKVIAKILNPKDVGWLSTTNPDLLVTTDLSTSLRYLRGFIGRCYYPRIRAAKSNDDYQAHLAQCVKQTTVHSQFAN